MWRNRFGGGFEPVVRQNTEWMMSVDHKAHFTSWNGNKNSDATGSNSHPVQCTAKCVCRPLEVFNFFLNMGTPTLHWKCSSKIYQWSCLSEMRRIKSNPVVIRLISVTTLMHKFFYSITVCMLHYDPQHVSSINMPIFRRTNCIITASGIVTLCTVQYCTAIYREWWYQMLW
jgi:hypothetical protein